MVDDPYSSDVAERPRGVLNKRERQYLLGETDIEPKSPEERSIRQDIREHIKHGLVDFQLLRRSLEERDREQIIPENSLHSDRLRPESSLRGGLTSMLAFAFQLEAHEAEFAESLEHAIEWAVLESGWKAEVDVDINLQRTVRLDEIDGRVEAEGSDAVSQDDLMALLLSGRIDFEEFGNLKDNRLGLDE